MPSAAKVGLRSRPLTSVKVQIRDKDADAIPDEQERAAAQPKSQVKIRQPDAGGVRKDQQRGVAAAGVDLMNIERAGSPCRKRLPGFLGEIGRK